MVLPFQVESSRLRGRLVRLGATAEGVLRPHAYPDEVLALLGEGMALASVLANALKFDGTFTLQTRGNGPVSMLAVDYRSNGRLRAYANVDRPAMAALGAEPKAPVPRLLGTGHLAFTVDQGDGSDRYQGIVELAGATLADCAHAYFQQSEQIGAGICLAAGLVPGDGGGEVWRAGALMIQRLPPASTVVEDEAADDDWRRVLALLGSVTREELLDPGVKPNNLLYRLFHEEGVRVWRAKPLDPGCTCSRQRVRKVLRSFPRAELETMVVDGRITATCEFCTAFYDFDARKLLASAEA
jgi:molecular chaperone Hsp33